MLKIKDDIDLKELEEYGIFPCYICNTRTGETRITALDTSEFSFKRLSFKKNKKRIATIYYESEDSWFLKLEEDVENLVNLDTLYDLIKDGIVEKV